VFCEQRYHALDAGLFAAEMDTIKQAAQDAKSQALWYI